MSQKFFYIYLHSRRKARSMWVWCEYTITHMNVHCLYRRMFFSNLSLSLSAITGDVGDHGIPQLSVSSFLNQLHFLMSYTPLCYPCI